MAASLVANPDTIIVDTDNGETTGLTQVAYDGDGADVEIWEQLIGEPSWTRLNLVALSGASTPAEASEAIRKGTIPSRSLTPGQVLRYGLSFANSGFNPNTPGSSEGRFLALLTIFALLKRASEPNWITDQSMGTGGTFPGTRYFAAIRLSDKAGRWSSLQEEFTTLRRRVEVRFHHIRIHDDGDDDTFLTGDDDGEVKFWLRVIEGSTPVQEFTWGRGDVSDEAGKNVVLFDPPLTCVIGPKRVTAAERSVGINITGTEYDDLFKEEHAENAGTTNSPGISPRLLPFDVPVGPGKETVPLMSEDVVAHPTNGSLHFTVKVSHAIDYVV